MICDTCQQPGVLNQANGKEFWYCRTCKTEIMLQEVDITPDDDDLYPFWDFADSDYNSVNRGYTVYANAPFLPYHFNPIRKHYYSSDKDVCAICGITAVEIANFGNEDCATRVNRILKGIP